MEMQPTVFVVDDDRDLCDCVAQVVQTLGVAVRSFSSGRELLEYCRPEMPGCMVLDIQMPDMSGLQLRQKMVAKGCHQPFIVLSGRGDVACAVEAMHLGALDFIEKPFSRQRLLDRIEDALLRDEEARKRGAEEAEVRSRAELLTARERQVLTLVGAGRITKQIARDLTISPKTVEVHRSNIMKKMRVESAAELLHLVARHPVISCGALPNWPSAAASAERGSRR
jgi:FixJ family two-component response regulator